MTRRIRVLLFASLMSVSAAHATVAPTGPPRTLAAIEVAGELPGPVL